MLNLTKKGISTHPLFSRIVKDNAKTNSMIIVDLIKKTSAVKTLWEKTSASREKSVNSHFAKKHMQ
jgi:hypothetical protein